jgi:hypothetical protein
MILSVKGMQDNSHINTGILFQLEGESEWDGLDVSFTYNGDNHEATFAGADLYITGANASEMLSSGVTPDSLPRDSGSNDWGIINE